MLSAFQVALFFIKKGADSGVPITPMKLIKLVYIAHGWHLGFHGRPLISEPVQAWKYGPVIPELYVKFKLFGNGPISWIPTSMYIPEITDSKVVRFLNSIWDAYSKYTGGQLSTMTHRENTPWWKVWKLNGGEERKGAVIPDAIITEHYRELITQRSANR
jgi:uncharacterized phage-associated protein